MKNPQWTLDKDSSTIRFEIRHLLISSIDGYFTIFDAMLVSSDFEFADAKIEMTIDIYSIDTHDTGNDEFLKTAAFFDADQFPSLFLKSTALTKVGGDLHKLNCDVTFLGVTKNIEFNLNFGGLAKDGFGISRAPVEINGIIDRNLFIKVTDDEPGLFGLGHELKFHADLVFVQEH